MKGIVSLAKSLQYKFTKTRRTAGFEHPLKFDMMEQLEYEMIRYLFSRYLAEGHNYNNRDLLFFISNQYGVGIPEIKKLLDKHPFWSTVSLVTVGRNHKFLSKYLPRSEIAKCPLVLFYPRFVHTMIVHD